MEIPLRPLSPPYTHGSFKCLTWAVGGGASLAFAAARPEALGAGGFFMLQEAG